MTTRGTEMTQEGEDSTLYHISFERLAELKRSPTAVLAARRCPSCPSLDMPLHELTDPEELVSEIAEYCGGVCNCSPKKLCKAVLMSSGVKCEVSPVAIT